MTNNEENDELLFIDEDDEEELEENSGSTDVWQILIVDDDKEIHTVTQLALSDLSVFGRDLEFLHAYSGMEAKKLIQEYKDIAVILLDVVMESDDAGLKVARDIREEMKLDDVRIVLRTGQPGFAPEESVIKDYDINDYKTKTELTRGKLVATLISSIRSFQQIRTIKQHKSDLEYIIDAVNHIMAQHDVASFSQAVIKAISGFLDLCGEGVVCAEVPVDAASKDKKIAIVVGASNTQQELIGQKLTDLDNGRIIQKVTDFFSTKEMLIDEYDIVIPICIRGYEAVVYLPGKGEQIELDEQMLNIFISNIATAYASVNLMKELKYAAFRDWLTKLPNRTEFINLLDQYVTSKLEGDIVALIDIDQFSDINDGLGQDVGNLLLISVSERLQEELGDQTVIARIGADVFGVIGHDTEITPENIFRIFETPFRAGEHSIPIKVTLGLCRKLQTSNSGLVILKQANISLNRAKKSIQERHEYYLPEMEEQTTWRLGIIRQLRTDFESRRLEVWYQPQLSFETGEVDGMEALLRWPVGDGDYISPATFIPLAEYSGLIVDIGAWVLERSLEDTKKLDDEGFPGLQVAVNVSMPQFRNLSFVDNVKETIMMSGLPPTQVELEITESLVMDDPKMVIDSLLKIKELGVKVAIDDFGTGFSSLSYLQQLPLDRIKVDRAFVSASDDEQGAAIVETILHLGKKLKLNTLAEGIETPEQEAFLKSLGCDDAQGFYYAKPMPYSELVTYLKSK